MAVYYASKAYVLSFGRAIGYELRRTGVTVTTLCPGPTATGFAEVAQMEGSSLFNGPMPVMQAAEVARLGYAALKAGRPVVVTGLLNKIIATLYALHAARGVAADCQQSVAGRGRAPAPSPELDLVPVFRQDLRTAATTGRGVSGCQLIHRKRPRRFFAYQCLDNPTGTPLKRVPAGYR